nr:uncharacterized protein LOC131752859 [Kogia breviceps]
MAEAVRPRRRTARCRRTAGGSYFTRVPVPDGAPTKPTSSEARGGGGAGAPKGGSALPGAPPRCRRSSPRPRPARRGRHAQIGPGLRGSGAVLAPVAPTTPSRLPGSDRFGVRRPRPPPLPSLREAARVRRSSCGQGARGRGRHEDTQALRDELGRPRGTGQERPSSRSWMRIPRAPLGTLTGEAPVSRAALPLPEAGRHERMELECPG